MNLFETFRDNFRKTREALLGKLSDLFSRHTTATEAFLEELELILISSDVGVDTSMDITKKVLARSKKEPDTPLSDIVRSELLAIFQASLKDQVLPTFEAPLPHKPYVVMVVGINGAGKTTTVAKLAHAYKQAGKSVLLTAGDTFRAAASEQLYIWAGRVGVPIVKQLPGSDPGAVAHDAIESALAKETDVVLIDTAGRLHNKTNLMQELAKIKRVIEKKLGGRAADEILLVLDGNTGQNAISQATTFTSTAGVTGLVLTKLDGSVKGGVVISISKSLGIPIRYIGIGEKMDDLKPFEPKAFIESLLG